MLSSKKLTLWSVLLPSSACGSRSLHLTSFHKNPLSFEIWDWKSWNSTSFKVWKPTKYERVQTAKTYLQRLLSNPFMRDFHERHESIFTRLEVWAEELYLLNWVERFIELFWGNERWLRWTFCSWVFSGYSLSPFVEIKV